MTNQMRIHDVLNHLYQGNETYLEVRIDVDNEIDVYMDGRSLDDLINKLRDILCTEGEDHEIIARIHDSVLYLGNFQD